MNGKQVIVTQYDHFKTLNQKARGLLMVRLHFAVHSFINLYVWDQQKEEEVLGCRTKERNRSTKQTHFLTLDKKICEFPLGSSFKDNDGGGQTPDIQNFSRIQELYISDFDGFMPRNNLIVDFDSEL